MTNNVPARPRFQRSSQFAQYLMQRLRIHTYPINLKYVCSHIIATIQPYSYYAKCLGCTVPDYIDIVTAQDGFTLYDGKRQRYVIAYNDTVPNYPRIRWTLAHELGHILLGHFKEFDGTRFDLDRCRCGLSDSQYAVLDVEANTFAGELLCSPAMIGCLPGCLQTVEAISQLFLVSGQAAEKALTAWEDYEGLHTKRKSFYQKQFQDYLDTMSIFSNVS